MRERPILFSGAMVRAILDGSKTQTRRVLQPQAAVRMGLAGMMRCPYGEPGDRLWVREAFFFDDVRALDLPPSQAPRDAEVYFRADGECCEQIPECQCAEYGGTRWRPSIHMPRWACRLVLEVTDVRVERLCDITEEDARAEGVECRAPSPHDPGFVRITPRQAFARLWDGIYAKRGFGWDANPFVWAVTFKRVDEDAARRAA